MRAAAESAVAAAAQARRAAPAGHRRHRADQHGRRAALAEVGVTRPVMDQVRPPGAAGPGRGPRRRRRLAARDRGHPRGVRRLRHRHAGHPGGGPGRQRRPGAHHERRRGDAGRRHLPGHRPADHRRARSARAAEQIARATRRAEPDGAAGTARTPGPACWPTPARVDRASGAYFAVMHEVAAAVLLPAGLVALGAEGRLLALADHLDAIGGDAQAHQVALHGVGAAFTEAQVVLRRAALVAVALDGDAQLTSSASGSRRCAAAEPGSPR